MRHYEDGDKISLHKIENYLSEDESLQGYFELTEEPVIQAVERSIIYWIEETRKRLGGRELDINEAHFDDVSPENKERIQNLFVDYNKRIDRYLEKSEDVRDFYLSTYASEKEFPWIGELIEVMDKAFERGLLLWYAPNLYDVPDYEGNKEAELYAELAKEALREERDENYYGLTYKLTLLPDMIEETANYRNSLFLGGFIGLDSKNNPRYFTIQKDNLEDLSEEKKEMDNFRPKEYEELFHSFEKTIEYLGRGKIKVPDLNYFNELDLEEKKEEILRLSKLSQKLIDKEENRDF